jgi:hypothetical protein
VKSWFATVLIAASLLGASGYYISKLQDRLDRLSAQIERDRLSLAACNSRVAIFMRMQERNRAINNLSDDDLRDVPGRWLLPPAADGGR